MKTVNIFCIYFVCVLVIRSAALEIQNSSARDTDDPHLEKENADGSSGGKSDAVDTVRKTEDEEFHDPIDEDGSASSRNPKQRRPSKLRQQTPSCTSVTDNGTVTGSCMSRKACFIAGGSMGDPCLPKGFVCCSLEKSCSDSTISNITRFINFGYPSPDSGTGACSLTINRFNNNICQMRFDFVTLELSQPDANGNCVTDFLTVTGGTYAAPIICGTNSGQHMYVDVDPEGGAVRLTVDRTAASMSQRMWSIEVSQIECTSKYKAPAGCLQYFTETSGTVNSFNFNQAIDETSIPLTTRQIVDMSYAVCIKAADGYCSVMWTRNTTGGDNAFTVSSNVAGIAESLIGDPAASSIATQCQTDYIVIPGAVDDTNHKNDRFCGAGFPNWVTSNMRPFIMFVATDSNELDDVLNRGFSLDYRQTIC